MQVEAPSVYELRKLREHEFKHTTLQGTPEPEMDEQQKPG
jgi:hypothetical protein